MLTIVHASELESFGQFFRESAVRSLRSVRVVGVVGALVLSAATFTAWAGRRRASVHLTGLP